MTLETRRRSLVSALAWRLAAAVSVLLLSGFFAATLVRWAPGFGMDERLLDARLSAGSRLAVEAETGSQNRILPYYWRYLKNFLQGEMGDSISLGRPVNELLSERLAVSFRSGLTGLALAWAAALLGVALLELLHGNLSEAAASLAVGALQCTPAALLALICVYLGAAPAVAIAAIVFPRIFRYLRDLARQARRAPHVLAAHALGIRPVRILAFHMVAPSLAELLSLAGVSVSMAVGALVPVEALCDSPGVGQLVWQAAMARDLPVLVNVTLLIAGLTVAANLAADTARSMREAEA